MAEMIPWLDIFLVTLIQALAWVIAVAMVFVVVPVAIASTLFNGPRQRLKKLRTARKVKS